MPLRLPSPDNRASTPTSGSRLLSPSWSQSRQARPATETRTYSQNGSIAFRDNLINNAEKLQRRVVKTIQKMTLIQRVLAGVALVVLAVLGILFLVFNERIFHALAPLAKKWKETKGGWTILWAMTFMTAFPPLIGYSTCGTLAGFVYGVWEGWLILATATVAGSFCSFIVSRTILRSYVERMVANDKRFAALALTLKHDGLKLLCMIRLCPLPYSISNGAMSTIPTIRPPMYALATAIITPKLLIHAFIGSRLAIIAETGEKMSTGTRVVNWLGVAIGICVGTFTGWFIYQKTMARAHELEAEEAQTVRDSVTRSGMPPRQFSDDPETQMAVDTLAQDDDNVDFFDDSPSPKLPYSDQHEEEDDPFGKGDGVDDARVGLQGSCR